jgi:hypothetical protein
LVEKSLDLLRALPAGSSGDQGPGLEANGAILIECDNIARENTRVVTVLPAPAVGDPFHYDTFLRRICDRYSQRILGG